MEINGTRREDEVTSLPSRNDGSYYWPIKKYKSGNSEETRIVAFASYCEAIKSNIVE